MIGEGSGDCTRQSLAENAMFRVNAEFGGKVQARTLDNQQVETATKCAALNAMAGLGMQHTLRML